MKKRVCCLLLGISMLCLPAQEVFAAPLGPATQAEEKKDEKKPHEIRHEKPEPPKPGEKPIPPHEKEKPHEVKKGPLSEKPEPPVVGEKPEPPVVGEKPVLPHEKEKEEAEDKQPLNTPIATPTAKPTTVPTVAPTAKPTAVPTVTPTATPTTIPSETEEDVTEAPIVSTLGSEVVKYALQFVGNPYKYGGTSLTNGADCSGFVQSVYKHFDYSLSRTSRDQAKTAGYMDVALKESELQQGDLIFYANSSGVVYHVAIYIGDGKVVHAANAKKGITVSEYTYMKPYKARRVLE